MDKHIQTVIDRLEAWAESEERIASSYSDTNDKSIAASNCAANYRELVRILLEGCSVKP